MNLNVNHLNILIIVVKRRSYSKVQIGMTCLVQHIEGHLYRLFVALETGLLRSEGSKSKYYFKLD